MTTAEFIGGPADGTVMAFPEDDLTGPPPHYVVLLPPPDMATALASYTATGQLPEAAELIEPERFTYCREPSVLDDGPPWWYLPERTANPTEGNHR